MLTMAIWLALAPVQEASGASDPPRDQQNWLQAAPPRSRVGSGPGTMFLPVYRNWALSCETPGFTGHRIQFDITLDAEGRIVAGPTPVRPQEDAGWRAAAGSARLALLRSAPFKVPPGFAGGQYRPTFNTTRACALPARPDED
jgi:hypothetical protein